MASRDDSFTAMLGYSALTMSVNQAIQSFGIAAATGEICCVLTGHRAQARRREASP